MKTTLHYKTTVHRRQLLTDLRWVLGRKQGEELLPVTEREAIDYCIDFTYRTIQRMEEERARQVATDVEGSDGTAGALPEDADEQAAGDDVPAAGTDAASPGADGPAGYEGGDSGAGPVSHAGES